MTVVWIVVGVFWRRRECGGGSGGVNGAGGECDARDMGGRGCNIQSL